MRKSLKLLSAIVLLVLFLVSCQKNNIVTLDKLITKALKYQNTTSIIFAPDLKVANLAYDKYVVTLPEEKRYALLKQVAILQSATNKNRTQEYQKLDQLYKEIVSKTLQGTRPSEQVFITVTERAKPYVRLSNIVYQNENIILADKEKPLKAIIAPKIGKEITEVYYYKITKLFDPVTNKLDVTKDKEMLSLSANDHYQIPLVMDIELDLVTINKRDEYQLSVVNSSISDKITIMKLANDQTTTKLDLAVTNKIIHNTTLQLKINDVPAKHKALVYINNRRHDVNLENELFFRAREKMQIELKIVPIHTVDIITHNNDYDVLFTENIDAQFNKETKVVTSSPDAKIILTFLVKETYEIKNLVNIQIGNAIHGDLRESLGSENIIIIDANTNLPIDFLSTEYDFLDLTKELPVEKQRYNRKYQLTFKVLSDIKIELKLAKIKFNLKLVADKQNDNTANILVDHAPYFTINVASFAEIDALDKIVFTFKPVASDKIKVLYINNKRYDVSDNFTLIVDNNYEIKYAIINTYRVTIKSGQNAQFIFPVEDISKPIEEGTYVTFTIKDSIIDLSAKLLVNGQNGIIEYITSAKQYRFKLTQNAIIELLS